MFSCSLAVLQLSLSLWISKLTTQNWSSCCLEPLWSQVHPSAAAVLQADTNHTSPSRSLQTWHREHSYSTHCFGESQHSPQGVFTGSREWGVQSCCDFTVRTLVQPKISQKARKFHRTICHLPHFLVFSLFPNIMLKLFKEGKFLLPPLHVFKKSTICPKALIHFIDASGQFWFSNPSW